MMEHASATSLPAMDDTWKYVEALAAQDSAQPSRLSTLERNNQKWDAHKDEIRHIYLDEDKTLQQTMQAIESTHHFKASVRKWKMTLKEWNFEKNIPSKEMSFMVEKADKRKREEGKETEFMRSGFRVPLQRLDYFKKRRTNDPMDSGIHEAGTPANISYQTPSTTELDLDYPEDGNDEVSESWTRDGYSDDTFSVDSGSTVTTVGPSTHSREHPDLLHARADNSGSIEATRSHSEANDRHQGLENLGADEEAPGDRSHLSLMDRARRCQSSRNPSETARLYIRALFNSFFPAYPYRDYVMWMECLKELSLLLCSAEVGSAEEQQMYTIFQEEFSMTIAYSGLSADDLKLLDDSVTKSNELSDNFSPWLLDIVIEQRLKPFWQGFLRQLMDSWPLTSQAVCQRFVHSFPRSGSNILRWRCRLDLAIELSHRKLEETHRQLVMSLVDLFASQWGNSLGKVRQCCLSVEKIFQESGLKQYIKDIFPNVTIEGYFCSPSHGGPPYESDFGAQEYVVDRLLYLIAALSLHCFSKAWWTFGHELMGVIDKDLPGINYHSYKLYGATIGRPAMWISLYLQLFDIYYRNKYSSEATQSLSRAFQIAVQGPTRREAAGIGDLIMIAKCQAQCIKLAHVDYVTYYPSYHQGLSTSARLQISEVISLLGNWSEKDSRLLEKSEYHGVASSSRASSSIGTLYGSTYTESLASGMSVMSLNYSSLFPSEQRS
ncbi:uncharacterized protein PAC_17962 [Phialocephala subalpina]|uniref:Clr5 domain-containing protein n=1 Tax=Phialocephala subalpina TaxID=576137 RepID=A0A1L7XSQ6_9HELO|nr:uncharacterized protein PAC_17962 [Phialocephala subalpina]